MKNNEDAMNRFLSLIDRVYRSEKFNLIAAALIVGAVLAAYSNSFTASFQFDDEASIHEYPAVRAVTLKNVLKLLRTTRPVTHLSLQLNYAVSGLNVVGWHVFNTAVHMANGILVYFFVLRTLLLPPLRATYAEKARGIALFCALIFSVHPIQTESVTYIISRSELLAGFFFLSAFLLFLKGAESGRFRWHALSFVSALLAMGSKEWAATLPVVILLYDYLFLSCGSFRAVLKRWPAYLLLVLPWLLALYILMLYRVATSAGFNISGVKGITPGTYLLTSFNVIWTYVRLLILPVNQNVDYDYPLSTTLFELPTLLSFLAHAAVVIALVWGYRKKGWLLAPFCIAWFYVILSPTQSFIPILDVIFEHRVYLPSMGLFLLFAAGYAGVTERMERRWEAMRTSRKQPV